MKSKVIFPFLLCLIAFCTYGYSQKHYKIDTVLDIGIYKSYFNYTARNPLYITYTLYKGGGDCDRDTEGFEFYVDDFEITATDDDYKGSGYHKGHMANAEDFAFSCPKEELTFRYYNCVPQTSKMNLGIWKTWETQIRKVSQKQKLFIVAGAIYGNKTIGDNEVGVPSHMYKIVYNAKTKTLLYCHLFPNDKSNTYKDVTITRLKKLAGYSTKYWSAN
jgi:endonuclease G, mitochondrial